MAAKTKAAKTSCQGLPRVSPMVHRDPSTGIIFQCFSLAIGMELGQKQSSPDTNLCSWEMLVSPVPVLLAGRTLHHQSPSVAKKPSPFPFLSFRKREQEVAESIDCSVPRYAREWVREIGSGTRGV